MAKLTESALRRIVRQETARMVAGKRALREAKGWYGGGSFGDEPMLDSGDSEVDGLWAEWVSCTDRLLGATVEAGMDSFPQEEDPRSEISVVRGMVDYIQNR